MNPDAGLAVPSWELLTVRLLASPPTPLWDPKTASPQLLDSMD